MGCIFSLRNELSIFSFVNMANLCPFLSLQRLTTLIFDKAVLEPTFCPMYAQLCFDIRHKMPRFPPSAPKTDEISFKRVLLNTCQKVFERTDDLSEEIRKMNAPDQEAEREDEVRLLNLRTLGNLRFCGELFLKRMLTEKVVLAIGQVRKMTV